ncbi:hypothetical protein BDQ94DRAFT_158021 [Aspergillus welwitschiae]|uniref:Uncharacterized protein n=1 Tax=Aspergillus welwitschiae TaxID=1341132 RepID=A0A3F3Q9J8_9EURO|nr:hypothetical protein BDQ94DRAFT_158021 [Aspergillus welwitschiae]RDH35838.1 hypothetical protein BDQ94DRAFT_158021 [Aspergillus welwitschiae]
MPASPMMSADDGSLTGAAQAPLPPDNGAHGGHPPSSVYSWWGPDESSWLLLADPNDISLDPTEQLKRQDFLLEYGHYAGRVWDCLVKASVALRLQITLSVVQFRDKLTQEFNDSSSGRQYWIRLLERCVEYLREQGLDIDLDMAKLAILVYSKRDLLCRARIGDVPASTSAALRREIEQANNHLPEVLSRDQSRSYSTRQRIRAFYGSPQDMKYSRLGAESALNRVFADRVDAAFQTINERIPVTFRPIRCQTRTKRSVSDPLEYERIDGKPADAPSSTVAFGNVEDACIYQDMCRDLDYTLGKNRGMGRKALQEIACELSEKRSTAKNQILRVFQSSVYTYCRNFVNLVVVITPSYYSSSGEVWEPHDAYGPPSSCTNIAATNARTISSGQMPRPIHNPLSLPVLYPGAYQ